MLPDRGGAFERSVSRHHVKLNHRRWSKVRRQVFERDGWRCQGILPNGKRCLRAGRLECHHIIPLDQDPSQDPYDLDVLEAICRGCHIELNRAQNRRDDPARDAWRELVRELSGKRD